MKQKSLDFLITMLAGCFYALTYPSFLGQGFFPLLFLSLPILFWKLEQNSSKYGIILILGYNLGLNLTGYYWVPHTLREFGQLPYIVSLMLGLLTTLVLQPHWWFYLLWKKFRPKWNWKKSSGIVINALILTLVERFVPQQFPSFVGSPWLALAPYLGLAPYFGVIIFSFMSYWISLELIEQFTSKKIRPMVWVCLLIFLLLNLLFPLKKSTSAQVLPIRIVQANIGNFLKITSENGDQNSFDSVTKKYEGLSTKENGFTPRLIIWPETAYPDEFYGLDSQLDQTFKRMMEKFGSEILIGGYDHNPEKSSFEMIESVYNSAVLMGEEKVKSIYHKNILIPFGETLPFGPLNDFIVSVVPAISIFAQGDGTPVMETKDGFRFVTPICYEILESHYMRSLLNQWGSNHFILNLTNDSWYGDTAEPLQHLFLSKWRALEFGLPIIRSTNTGITSVIYPDGSESKRLGINETGILDINLEMAKPETTPYQRFGIIPFIVLLGIILGFMIWKEKTENQP